jgi:hypothetical protein
MPGFQSVLVSGTFSANLSPNSFTSDTVTLLKSCAAALYTAGCEVSLKEGEKKTSR